MAATVAAPLPFSTGFLEALGRRGIRKASHVEGVFGKDSNDKGRLRARMRQVVGPDVGEEVVEEWVSELEHFLPRARAQALGDAERIARVVRIVLEDTVRRKRRQDWEERPYPLAAAISEIAWAPPPVKRWRTQRVARRAAGGDEPDARKKAEQKSIEMPFSSLDRKPD